MFISIIFFFFCLKSTNQNFIESMITELKEKIDSLKLSSALLAELESIETEISNVLKTEEDKVTLLAEFLAKILNVTETNLAQTNECLASEADAEKYLKDHNLNKTVDNNLRLSWEIAILY